MSPAKTLYVRDEDMSTWEEAEKLARNTTRSLSTLVALALKRFINEVEKAQRNANKASELNVDLFASIDRDMERITVDVGDPQRTVGFEGCWLVPPDRDETRTSEPGHDAGAYYGVALTKRGRIAVYTAHCNDAWPAVLNDYNDLDEAAAENLPPDMLALAAQELGQERVIWRDI